MALLASMAVWYLGDSWFVDTALMLLLLTLLIGGIVLLTAGILHLIRDIRRSFRERKQENGRHAAD